MATDLQATHVSDGVVFPNTAAINSSGPSATDGTEMIAVGFNNYQSGRQQALLDYAGLTPTGVVESATVSQELEAFRKGFAVGPGMSYPRYIEDSPAVNGDRMIMLAEQGILIASYPELTAKVYCGDANNTARHSAGGKFYKSSDAAGTTPNIAGPYLQLPANPEPMFLKQYLGDTTGSLDFVVTSTVAITSIKRAVAIPYKTTEGGWRLIFNITYDVASIARTAITMSLSGVLFKNTTSFEQSCTVSTGPSTGLASVSSAINNTANVSANHASSAESRYGWAGDVELDSKPTWADDFEIPWGITY